MHLNSLWYELKSFPEKTKSFFYQNLTQVVLCPEDLMASGFTGTLVYRNGFALKMAGANNKGKQKR